MKTKTKRFVVGFVALAWLGLVVAVISLLARSKQQAPQIVQVDGSSTVFPITEAIAKEYNDNYNRYL